MQAPRVEPARLWLLGVLSVGLLVRLLLACVLLPDASYWSDVALFASWAHSLAYHGPAAFYEAAGFADYPAGFLAVLWGVGTLSTSLGQDDLFLTRTLVKLPAIAADVGIALCVYAGAAQVAGRRAAVGSALVYLFNPITWFDSAVWGQNDAIGTLGVCLAILALIGRKPELASLAAVGAVLIKPQFAIVLPLIVVVLLHRHIVHGGVAAAARGAWQSVLLNRSGPIRLVTSAAASIALVWTAGALFGQSPPDVIAHMSEQANLYPFASMSAFNPWAVFSMAQLTASGLSPLIPWADDRTPLVLFVTPYFLGLTLFVGVGVAALWRLRRHLGSDEEGAALWACAATTTLAFFVLATRMHERYAFPFFALALPVASVFPLWRFAYAIAGIGCLANMYAIYALSWQDALGYTGPDRLTAALASPAGIAVASTLSLVGLVCVLVRDPTPRFRGGEGRSSPRVRFRIIRSAAPATATRG